MSEESSSSAPSPPLQVDGSRAIAAGFVVEVFDGDRLLYGLLPPDAPVVVQSLSREGEAWSQCLSARPARDAASGGRAWVEARSELRAAALRAGLHCDAARCAAGERFVELDALRVCHAVNDGTMQVELAFQSCSDTAHHGLGVFRTVLQDEHVVFTSRELLRHAGEPPEERYVVRYEQLQDHATALVQQWAGNVDATRLAGPGPWEGSDSVGYRLEHQGWRTTMWGRGTSISLEVTNALPAE